MPGEKEFLPWAIVGVYLFWNIDWGSVSAHRPHIVQRLLLLSAVVGSVTLSACYDSPVMIHGHQQRGRKINPGQAAF